MKDRIEIALAQPDDAELLADISKRAFDSDIDVGAPGSGGPDGYDSVEVHRNDTKRDGIDYWKFLFNDVTVGGARVYNVSNEHGYIYGVFVDPDYHGRGIGTETFRLIEEKYPEVKKWTLDTPEWNPRTKGFYEKIRFVQSGILRWVPSFDLRYFVKIVSDDYKPPLIPISNLQEGMESIVVRGTIEDISKTREITSTKDGKEHKVAEAKLADDSGHITFVLWNDFIRQVRKGEKVIIENGYVSSSNGRSQLNIARRGQIIITHPI